MTALPAGLPLDTVRHAAEAALANVVPGDTRFSISELALTEHTSPRTGRPAAQLVIRVATDSPATVLGQYVPFGPGEYRGHHSNYLFGYIHGYVAAALQRDLWPEVELVLDVIPPAAVGDTYDYVTARDAVEAGLIDRDSPLDRALRRHNLPYILRAGNTVSGPSHAMLEVVSRVAAELTDPTVLDLFAGSCALSKVAQEGGARGSVCVDTRLDESFARETLGEWYETTTLVKQDVFSFRSDQSYGLVIVDPFYDSRLDTVRRLLPTLRGRYERLILNLGPPEPQFATLQVRRNLSALGFCWAEHVLEGECVAVCRG